ncbi:MAG: hypothetical protein E8D46_11380 [Nitrospira sp.]|nr:MAG: hypothetical protein E8D46_11380 [Nitrospira sp.]
MDNFAKDFVVLLQYLLPGFLAAWVFYGFTSYPKPSQFERVIQALIFTFIIQTLVVTERWVAHVIGNYWPFGGWSDQPELFPATVTAIALGAIFSFFANRDGFHKYARKLGVTRETSFPSEWFGTFLKNVTYIVLHLGDERRLYGWPIEWPSDPSEGHFVLEQPSWIVDGKDVPITGVNTIMINVKDVKWVEFMDKTWEKENVKEKP